MFRPRYKWVQFQPGLQYPDTTRTPPGFFSVRQIQELREVADCSVTIVTGDSVLTACHVAREVGLINKIDDAGVALSSLGKGKNKGSVGKSKKSRASKSTMKAITKSALVSEASGKGRKTALLLTATEREVSVHALSDCLLPVHCTCSAIVPHDPSIGS